jgi:hypothetical protein
VNPIEQTQRAWRLYQTDSRADTVVAVVLVGAVVFPFVKAWRDLRRGNP